MKFRTQLFLGNGITLTMLFIIGLTVFFSVTNLMDNTKWVEHTYKVIGKVNQLTSFMVDQETGMRGFVVSGQEEFLEPYVSGKNSFDELIDELKETVSDNPAQVKRLERVEKLAIEWKTKVADNYINTRREVLAGEDLETEIAEIVETGVGKKSMDSLRDLVAKSGLSKANQAQIILDMINMETGLRGFLLNEKEVFLEPYDLGKSLLDGHLSEMGASIEIRNSAYAWINNYAEKLIDLGRREMKTTDMIDLYALFDKKEGKTYMDEIRVKLAEITDVEASLLEERLASQETTATTAISVIIIGTLFAFIIGILLIIIIGKNVMKVLGGEPSEVAAMANEVASGSLNIKFDQDKIQTGLYGNMRNMVEKLREIVEEVRNGADAITSASIEMNESSQQMSQNANEQASTTEEVSSSMEEMVASIQQNTSNSQQTEKMALKAVEDVEEGKQAINQTVDSMKDIADKVSIISEIARQTNILALNAAVEAARAGEAGKGFAVVAAEVRKLAERSQVSAVEIDTLSKSSVSVAEKAGKLFEDLVPNIQKTAQLVQEINASSSEQNSGAQQVNGAIQQLNQVTQQNAASSEELASNSEELASQADTLRETINFFRMKNENETAKKWTASTNSVKRKVNPSTKGKGHPSPSLNGGFELNLNDADISDSDFERY